MDRCACSQAKRVQQKASEDSHLGPNQVMSNNWLTFIEVGKQWLNSGARAATVALRRLLGGAARDAENFEELQAIEGARSRC